jgi:hypothetical protein
MSVMRRLFALVFFGCALAFSFVSEARAECKEGRAEAESRFKKGVELFQEADFQGSLVEFKRSYECVPNYNVLYNIGQVYFQLKDYANALKTLQQYLDAGGSRVPATRKSQVDKDIEQLKDRVALVSIRVNVTGAEVSVDDVSIGTSPFTQPVLVSTGRRRFSAAKDGYSIARETKEIASGDASEVTLTLNEAKPGDPQLPPSGDGPNQDPNTGGTPPITPPPPDDGKSYVVPGILWGVTGASAIAWGVVGGLALSSNGTLGELKRTEGRTPEEIDSKANSTSTLAIVSDVLMGTTIVAAGFATFFTITVATSEEPAASTNAPKPGGSKISFGPGNLMFEQRF